MFQRVVHICVRFAEVLRHAECHMFLPGCWDVVHATLRLKVPWDAADTGQLRRRCGQHTHRHDVEKGNSKIDLRRQQVLIVEHREVWDNGELYLGAAVRPMNNPAPLRRAHLRFIHVHDGNLRGIGNCARQGLCRRPQARTQAHAHGVQERPAWSGTRLRYTFDVIAASFMELLHLIRPQSAASGASAWVDHAARRRTARLPSSVAATSRNRKAGSNENAKSRCAESPRFRSPFQLRCSSGLRIVVAEASAKQFPPEAGAFSGERRQRDVEVGCGALGLLFHRPRPIEP